MLSVTGRGGSGARARAGGAAAGWVWACTCGATPAAAAAAADCRKRRREGCVGMALGSSSEPGGTRFLDITFCLLHERSMQLSCTSGRQCDALTAKASAISMPWRAQANPTCRRRTSRLTICNVKDDQAPFAAQKGNTVLCDTGESFRAGCRACGVTGGRRVIAKNVLSCVVR